jgi:hypothetical protein
MRELPLNSTGSALRSGPYPRAAGKDPGVSWSNCSKVATKPAPHQGHVGLPPRVAYFVAPPWRADRSCGHVAFGAWSGWRWGPSPDRATTAARGLGAKDRRRRLSDTSPYRRAFRPQIEYVRRHRPQSTAQGGRRGDPMTRSLTHGGYTQTKGLLDPESMPRAWTIAGQRRP